MDIKNSGLDLVNYDIWYKPFWHTKEFYNIAAIIIIAIILIIIFIIMKKFKKIKNISAIDLFNLKLNLLIKKDINTKDFYVHLIWALREYLSSKFDSNILTYTDQEILECIHKLNLPKENATELSEIISRAQILKFSNTKINQDEMQNDLQNLKAAIESVNQSILDKDSTKN